ncbi:hypothetical protein A3F58_00560 [Candidatus Roizmanbacteria bacterium RIFCSPHIGHO2_12_FULL_37_9b]|nr:MAG: hypothetical protein A3F58_00560 [Candidatus Roizmanbacteria bacterium RIFCSPHIGHO2_12_FULL_37_9b]
MLKIPKLAAIAVGSILSIVFLVIGFSVVQNLSGRAEDQVPRDVVVSYMTTSSARITYATGTNTQGVVEYGVSPTTLNLLAPEGGSDTDHEMELTLLSAGTTYYFQISIGGKKFDNAGVPWSFTTKSSDSSDLEELISLSPTSARRPTSVREPTSNPESTCSETTCEKIKLKLGRGCTTQDYMKCIKRNPTFAPLTTP